MSHDAGVTRYWLERFEALEKRVQELEARALPVHIQWQGETSWMWHQGCNCNACRYASAQVYDAGHDRSMPWLAK